MPPRKVKTTPTHSPKNRCIHYETLPSVPCAAAPNSKYTTREPSVAATAVSPCTTTRVLRLPPLCATPAASCWYAAALSNQPEGRWTCPAVLSSPARASRTDVGAKSTKRPGQKLLASATFFLSPTLTDSAGTKCIRQTPFSRRKSRAMPHLWRLMMLPPLSGDPLPRCVPRILACRVSAKACAVICKRSKHSKLSMKWRKITSPNQSCLAWGGYFVPYSRDVLGGYPAMLPTTKRTIQ